MPESRLKQLWNAVKPPPPVPRRVSEHAPMADSGWVRFLRSIKPPPAVQAEEGASSKAEKRQRRTILLRAASILAIMGGGGGAYVYLSSAPSRAQTVLEDGMRLMAQGDSTGAESRFTRAVGIRPQLAAGYLQRGLVRTTLRNGEGAREDFEHAIALDPNMAAAHTALGLLYRDRGDLTRAVSQYTLSIQLASNTDALYQRAQLYASLGQHDKALADYDAAIHEEPDAPLVYRARAMSRDALGDHNGAEEDRALAWHIEHH